MSDNKHGRVTYARTLNLGNYRSAKLEYSFEFDLNEMEPAQAFAIARGVVNSQAQQETSD